MCSHLNILCPQCKQNYLRIVTLNTGSKFIGCSGYPNCDYHKSIDDSDICPKCHVGKLMGRKGKWGVDFLGCSRYPHCNYILSAPKKGICPKCRKGKIYCKERRDGSNIFVTCTNFPKCNYVRNASVEEKEEYIKNKQEDIDNLDYEYIQDIKTLAFFEECGPLMDGDDYIGFRD